MFQFEQHVLGGVTRPIADEDVKSNLEYGFQFQKFPDYYRNIEHGFLGTKNFPGEDYPRFLRRVSRRLWYTGKRVVVDGLSVGTTAL